MEPDFALMAESFSVIDDPRKVGMTTYSAQHLIFMTLCGLLCGCDTWVKIADHLSFRRKLFTSNSKNALPYGWREHTKVVPVK
jgi:hypothetical protein